MEDDYGNYSTFLRIEELKFEVVSETPCGYWIYYGFTKKWVSKTSRKRYAHPTREEAWESFKARKKRQASIYKARYDQAIQALNSTRPICKAQTPENSLQEIL